MTHPVYALALDPASGEWLSFKAPVQCVEALSVNEVPAALAEVERLSQSRRLWAVGWVSYEASSAFDPGFTTKDDNEFPKVWFALFDEPIRLPSLPINTTTSTLGWNPEISESQYERAIKDIHSRIKRGDTYQVNYSFRLSTTAPSAPLNLFQKMVQSQAGRYSAYLSTERFSILSASPELFFEKKGRTITSKPMKGTRRRGRTNSEDETVSINLAQSEKDRAENTMIVDMVRNDLSRIADRGSVKVSDLCTVEKYPHIFQMTSEVTAQSDASLLEIFTALFPAASITGAPKGSTMEIISQLENSPRRIYTGALGVISPHGRMWFNVAIRTTLVDHSKESAEYGVGSGIVWDSQATLEFQECVDKAGAVTALSAPEHLFETILWEPHVGFFLLEEHLTRLSESAYYHQIPFDYEKARVMTRQLEETLSQQSTPHRIRLKLGLNGTFSAETSELIPFKEPYTLSFAQTPVSSSDRRLFHKTAQREPYTEALGCVPACADIILWNERGEITETRIANIALELQGTLFTPPVSSGLLAGCYRKHLLEKGAIHERVLFKEDVLQASRIVLLNSLRRSWEGRLIAPHSHQPLTASN